MLFCLVFLNDSSVLAQTKILIAYYSKTGNTELMGEAVAAGARQVEGVLVEMKQVADVSSRDLLDADAIIVGSPVYNANVAPQVQEFISGWPFEGSPLKNKIGAAFVTAGGISAGEEITQMNILHSMMIFGMIILGSDHWTSPFGASAVIGETPFDDVKNIDPVFLEKGKNLGKRVAQITNRLHSKN
ncbi:MAG: flavodoxin family protein [Bacteroidota bacterium]